jgi:hypothetical protein
LPIKHSLPDCWNRKVLNESWRGEDRMQTGSHKSAIVLAQSRWAALHSFDLDPETWERLFRENTAGDVLQAIQRTKGARDPRPEKIFPFFEKQLNILTAERNGFQNIQ